jgi:hypothetical protein
MVASALDSSRSDGDKAAPKGSDGSREKDLLNPQEKKKVENISVFLVVASLTSFLGAFGNLLQSRRGHSFSKERGEL